MNKAPYVDKAIKGSETVVSRPIKKDNFATACEAILKMNGNEYAKARLEFLREVKHTDADRLQEALAKLVK